MGCSSSKSTSAGNPRKGVVLGYFDGLRGGPRGNATKFLLNYCGVKYTDRKFPLGDGQKMWKAYKATGEVPFANLPYLIDGDFKITETLAVQQYICAKWKPELLGSTPAEKAKIYQMTCLIYSAFVDKIIMPAFEKSDRDECYDIAAAALTPIIERLES